jgi:hypothetical protein
VCFTGGRDTHGPGVEDAVRDVVAFLSGFYGVGLGVLHGDARGADTVVHNVCTELGVKTKAYPADWGRGKSAGIQRNEHMGRLLVDWAAKGHSVEVIALPGGRGTAHMARFAGQLGIDVTHIPIPGFGVSAD